MIDTSLITYEEYKNLINSVEWKIPSKRLVERGLKNSINAKYIIDNEVVGIARLITDGGYIGLIADVIVKPNFQHQGIGSKLIESLLEQANSHMEVGESMMIQLLAATDKTNFYERFGFKVNKEVVESGMYMWYLKK